MPVTVCPAGMFSSNTHFGGGIFVGGIRKRMSRAKRKETVTSWLIMLPGLILMTFFVWEPLFESVRMSLYKTRNTF